jgi:hypothetical protein
VINASCNPIQVCCNHRKIENIRVVQKHDESRRANRDNQSRSGDGCFGVAHCDISGGASAVAWASCCASCSTVALASIFSSSFLFLIHGCALAGGSCVSAMPTGSLAQGLALLILVERDLICLKFEQLSQVMAGSARSAMAKVAKCNQYRCRHCLVEGRCDEL